MMGSTIVRFSLWVLWCVVSIPEIYPKEVTVKDRNMDNWFGRAFQAMSDTKVEGDVWNIPEQNRVSTCGVGDYADFWLLTAEVTVTKTFAQLIIYVDIEVGLRLCYNIDQQANLACYSNQFEVYIYRGQNKTADLSFGNEAHLSHILRVFSPLYNISNNTSLMKDDTISNQKFFFYQNTSQSVILAIRSKGACGTLFRMKMYYYLCEETSYNSIRFGRTPSPSREKRTVVAGNCSDNAVPPNNNATIFKGYCLSNGTWNIDDSKKCLCISGYEQLNETSGCTRCPASSYKKNTSTDSCTQCAKNTMSSKTRTGCDCKKDNYRVSDDDNPEPLPCYPLPHFNEKPTVSFIGNGVNLSWTKPDNSLDESIFYNVTCFICIQPNTSCNASCSKATEYHPSHTNLAKTWLVVSNLEYGKSYLFRVYAKNSLNDQVGREKWNYTETDRVNVPSKKKSGDDGSSLYIIIGTVCLLLILIILTLICLSHRKRGASSTGGYMNRGVKLPDVGRRLYVDPSNYEDPESALVEFTNELDSKLVFLERKIGGGEFGVVYKGVLRTKDKKKIPIAAKTLKHDADEKSKRDFTLEASVMGQFDNPNVIRLEGVIIKSTPRMIILEYMSNGSLDNYLKGKESILTNLQLIGMARGVAAGMKYLAEMNFVHRDLAARNILVNDDLLCKIADFGLSRELETSCAEYSTHGGKIPVRWTAPEAVNLRKFSSASDVWSFGIVLWEIMSYAKRPYWEWDNFKVLRELDSGYRLPPPHKCPRGVHKLMLHCWKADRIERPNFAQITVVIDQWIRSPEALDTEITSLTPIIDGESDMEYATPDDSGMEKHEEDSILTHSVLTEVNEKIPNYPLVNDLVYVIPLDDQTKPQEGSIAEPEKRGTNKDISLQFELFEDNDGYLLPADGETNHSRNAQILEPSAYAKLNENARDGRDIENTGDYQKLLKRDSDCVIPANGEADPGEIVQIIELSAYAKLEKNRQNGGGVENVNDYQKLLKHGSDYVIPADGESAFSTKVQALEPSTYTQLDKNRKNGKDIENDDDYQKLLKRNSDVGIPSDSERASYDDVRASKATQSYKE